jgi:hypothetical protein
VEGVLRKAEVDQEPRELAVEIACAIDEPWVRLDTVGAPARERAEKCFAFIRIFGRIPVLFRDEVREDAFGGDEGVDYEGDGFAEEVDLEADEALRGLLRVQLFVSA